MKIVIRRRVLVAGAILALLLWPLMIGSPENTRCAPTVAAFTLEERLEIVYVEVNQTSNEIYCKLRSTGLTLMEVSVNDSVAKTREPLPILMPAGYNYTCVFRYDGPWEGSIFITFYTSSDRAYDVLVELPSGRFNQLWEMNWKYLASKHMSSAQSKIDQVRGSASPEAEDFIRQAGIALWEARNAYSRGYYESAYYLAGLALYLADRAIAAEERYRILVAGMVAGTVALPLIILLLLRRRGRRPQSTITAVRSTNLVMLTHVDGAASIQALLGRRSVGRRI